MGVLWGGGWLHKLFLDHLLVHHWRRPPLLTPTNTGNVANFTTTKTLGVLESTSVGRVVSVPMHTDSTAQVSLAVAVGVAGRALVRYGPPSRLLAS